MGTSSARRSPCRRRHGLGTRHQVLLPGVVEAQARPIERSTSVEA
jgi:hypothetical protein